ncbi:MAG: hypothetical protein WD738_01110 [Pirellulales bacterium]
MAENESLDLQQPGGRRWMHVHDAVRKQKPPEEIAAKIKKRLPRALRKAFKEWGELGVTFKDFLLSRSDDNRLNYFVRQCERHDYAHLFTLTARSYQSANNEQLIRLFLDGILESVFDQITQDVVGREPWSDVATIQAMLERTQRKVSSDVNRIAQKLAADPTWLPTVARRKAESITETESLLTTSMLGIGTK